MGAVVGSKEGEAILVPQEMSPGTRLCWSGCRLTGGGGVDAIPISPLCLDSNRSELAKKDLFDDTSCSVDAHSRSWILPVSCPKFLCSWMYKCPPSFLPSGMIEFIPNLFDYMCLTKKTKVHPCARVTRSEKRLRRRMDKKKKKSSEACVAAWNSSSQSHTYRIPPVAAKV